MVFCKRYHQHSSLGCASIGRIVPVSTDLECELLESLGQPWEGLVSGSGLRDNGELGGWSGNVSAGDPDALDIGVLV